MSAAFDERELLERIDNDWEFLTLMVQMLSTDGRAVMEEVRRAADGGDAVSLGRAAHTLKGVISNFCAPAAHASAAEVEKLGKSGDLSGAPEAMNALETNFDALVAGLTDFVTTRSARPG